jgi:inosine/xanthosine triphosphate pyrophosphatase family protein
LGIFCLILYNIYQDNINIRISPNYIILMNIYNCYRIFNTSNIACQLIKSNKTYLLSMLNILFATSNPGKVVRYKKFFKNDDVKIYTCQELGIPLPQVDEDADTEKQNSEEKAKQYFSSLIESEVELPKGKWMTLGLDTGLYFEGVNRKEQPGPHIKTIAGAGVFKETQEETFSKMAIYYSALAKKYGGKVNGFFKDVFTLYDGQELLQSEAKRPITLVDTMFFKDINFPVGSFFKVRDKYFHEFTDDEYLEYINPSFQALKNIVEKKSSV